MQCKQFPNGETYRDIAEQIDHPKACRAVGMANNRNPISMIVPCHRFIGTDGSSVGYGGGLNKNNYYWIIKNKRFDNREQKVKNKRSQPFTLH
jgi:methylated-DNA-[protein]-cysteine S-methyltransferase